MTYLALFSWYFSGIFGIMALWKVDKYWRKLKVNHIVLIILFWAWLGLCVWVFVLIAFIIHYESKPARILIDKDRRHS